MNHPNPTTRQGNEKSGDASGALGESDHLFRTLFQRSADAIFLFDPSLQVFVDCNQAAVDMLRASSKEQLLMMSPAELSPEFQSDGCRSREKAPKMTELALAKGSHRFEWLAQRFDGTEFPIEVLTTPIRAGDNPIFATVCRDITERKKAELEVLQLNASLEERVDQRTGELVRANDQLKEAQHQLRGRAEQVQKHRDVLLQLAQADTSDLDLALKTICSQGAATLQAARVGYWSLVDGDTALVRKTLHLQATQKCDQDAKSIRLAATDYPAYFAALSAKRPIVARRALTHVATAGLAGNYLRPLGISSKLDAPVWIHGEVVGVLCHEHIGPSRDWSLEEIAFASALSAMVSLALEESNRARSERSLRESEEKFRALFEASSQGVILHDEHQILEVNPACLSILGFRSADEIIGKHPAEMSAPIQPNGERADVLARKHIASCLSHGSARFDWLVRNSRQEDVPIEVILTSVHWGGRQMIQAVFNSIAERKRAESELRESARRLCESEARFSTAFRVSPVLTTISRLGDATFVEVNEAFVKWFGLSREEIVGRNAFELGLWRTPEERLDLVAQLQRAGCVRDLESQFCNRRGGVGTMLLTASIIELNREPHLIAFAQDITQRKRSETEMQKALAREKELGQLRSKFVSMVSHEFRTPLGIIQSSADILDSYSDQLEGAERQEHLHSIRKNILRMVGLMEEVLLIGRFDAGKMDFKPVLLDLRVFLAKLVDEVISATNRRCPILTNLEQLAAPIAADERLLRSILTNLLTNGIKYSEAGCPVRLEITRNGSGVVFTINDRGIGIPQEDREWLFSAFHRGRNVGDRVGTGLGLVIVKRCVDLHGGRIDIASKLGQGTTVTVTLPQPRAEPVSTPGD